MRWFFFAKSSHCVLVSWILVFGVKGPHIGSVLQYQFCGTKQVVPKVCKWFFDCCICAMHWTTACCTVESFWVKCVHLLWGFGEKRCFVDTFVHPLSLACRI